MAKLQTLLSFETGNFAMENFKTLEKITNEIDCDFEDAVRVVMESDADDTYCMKMLR